jgi:hypothetical protein
MPTGPAWRRRCALTDEFEPAASIDVAAFDAAWHRSWPGIAPVAYRLRTLFPSRWVRFSSLPDRKRYPTGEAEQAEVLHRHHTVLQALMAQAEPLTTQLVAITCSWSGTEEPVPRYSMVADAMPEASYWRSDDRATDTGRRISPRLRKALYVEFLCASTTRHITADPSTVPRIAGGPVAVAIRLRPEP